MVCFASVPFFYYIGKNQTGDMCSFLYNKNLDVLSEKYEGGENYELVV